MLVRKIELFGVAFDERHSLVKMSGDGALPTDREHIGVDVADDGTKAFARRSRGGEGDVAGSAGYVEQHKRLRGPRRIELYDHCGFPGAMQSSRHQVVHQVVALRDIVEDAVDQRLLVAKRHP